MYLLLHLPLEHFGKCWAAEGREAKFSKWQKSDLWRFLPEFQWHINLWS